MSKLEGGEGGYTYGSQLQHKRLLATYKKSLSDIRAIGQSNY
jgi:hypothetical protein